MRAFQCVCTHKICSCRHDHCETPFEAYRDIEPLLFQLAVRLKKTKAELMLYDPYFCQVSTTAFDSGVRPFTRQHTPNSRVVCPKLFTGEHGQALVAPGIRARPQRE